MRKAIRPEVPQPLSTTRLSSGSCYFFFFFLVGNVSWEKTDQCQLRLKPEGAGAYLQNKLHPLRNLCQSNHHRFTEQPLKTTSSLSSSWSWFKFVCMCVCSSDGRCVGLPPRTLKKKGHSCSGRRARPSQVEDVTGAYLHSNYYTLTTKLWSLH